MTGSLCLGAPASAAASTTASAAVPSAQAVQQVTDASTGQQNAPALVPRRVCPPATPGHATCYAQALAIRSAAAFVHPRLKTPASPIRFATRPGRANARSVQPALAAGQPQPGTPAYLQQAYDLSYLSQTAGAGDTVAIVDAYDDPTAESDLATYRAKFGLPACTTANGCFHKVNQAGGTASYPVADTNWEMEIALDLAAVSALCPQCHILLVEASSSDSSDLAAAQAEAAALGANQISDSWGGVSGSAPPGTFTFAGVATVAASGDNGYPGAGQNDYPAALAGVTSAGGTTLTPASGSARGYQEWAWSETGSGCDLTQSKPSWQHDSGCTGRSYNDLSAAADPNTGLTIYDSGNGGWLLVGGTSEASPLIAAYYALTGASAQTPAWAYQHMSVLNDPATGSNGSCAAAILYICNAASGYDGPTGAGSISGAVVAGGPGIGGPSSDSSDTLSVTPTTAQLQGGIYPNSSDTTWWIQYGVTTAYGQQTGPTDIGAGTSPAPVTASLTGLAPGTTYHYRLVAQNAYATAYGYDYTLTTATLPRPSIGYVTATVSGTAAALTGVVNAQGSPASYRFDYGTTPALGQSTGTQTTPAAGDQAVTATLSGLAPRTTYYYELVAANANGTAGSGASTFVTGASQSSSGSAPAAKAASARIASKGAGNAAVSIGNLGLAPGRASVAVTCRTASPCQVRVRLTLGGRQLGSATVTIRGHRTMTVRIRLSRKDGLLVRAHPARAHAVLLEQLQRHYLTVGQKSFAGSVRPAHRRRS